MEIGKLTWKEKFSSIVLITIGIILLLLQIVSILSNTDSMISTEPNSISIKKSELIDHLRFFIMMLIALASGILLYKQKKLGWIIAIPFLLISIFLSGYFIWFLYVMYLIPAFILMIVGFTIMVVSVLFLLIPAGRQKYRVDKRTYLPTLLVLIAICCIFFFLK